MAPAVLLCLAWLCAGHGAPEAREGHGAAPHEGDGAEPHEAHEAHVAAEGHEGHKSVSDAAFGSACMLLGIVACILTLFYLVNNDDDDIRRYSWEMVFVTVSIFIAVLVFMALRDAVHDAAGHTMLVDVCLALVMTLAVQVTALAAVYLADNLPSSRGVRDAQKLGISPKVIACRAFGGTMAHICGFAWINLWAELQIHLHERSANGLLVGVVVLAAFCWLFLMNVCCRVRTWIIMKDGQMDESESMWEHVTSECEIEAAGLNASFVLMQAVRYYIGGVLPNAEGVEEGNHVHSEGQILSLLSVMVLSTLLLTFHVGLLMAPEAKSQKHSSAAETWHGWWGRQIKLLWAQVLTYMNSWCIVFSVGWIVTRDFYPDNNGGVLTCVFVAVACSYLSFGLIMFFDKIADALGSWGWKAAMGAVIAIIQSVGIMVGFSWERSFDRAIEDVAIRLSRDSGGASEQAVTHVKLASAILVSVVVLPALYWHVAPRVLIAREEALGGEERGAGNPLRPTSRATPPAPPVYVPMADAEELQPVAA